MNVDEKRAAATIRSQPAFLASSIALICSTRMDSASVGTHS
jgi:hypothetical protein